MKNEKVLDIKISETETGYRLYIPIKTGHLSSEVTLAELPLHLKEFLYTALRTEVRRFGENPK